ncbi:MAG: peptidase T, partial [Flavobacterium sp.]
MSAIEFSQEWKDTLLNRFLTYVKIYSTSDAESETTPSTERQWEIAKYITEELKNLGLEDVSIDDNGYIMGYVPSNLENDEQPTIGF